MKISTRFSITKNLYVFILFAFLCSKAVIAQTQPTFNFSQGPTLLANGAADEQIGAKYIYQDIEVSDDGLIIDAVITIVDIVNVDLTQANNFTIDTALGVDDRFEPTINTFDGDGYVEWKVEFVLDGSVIDANDVGIPANLSAFSVEAIDVDGFEYFEAIVTSSYTLEGGTTPPTDLVVSQNGAYTRFQSDVDFAAGIDIANTEFIVRINYENTNVIFFRNGSSNDSSDRQNSMSFLGEVTFDIEDTTIINSPPVVVDNLGNVINVNTNLNTNVLTGSSDPDTNLDIASVILIDPSNPANQGSVGTPLVIPGVGTYTVTNTGVVNFVPVTDYAGDASILFTVMDDLDVGSNQGVLEITLVSLCNISAIVSSNESVCNDNTTASNINDDTFTADIEVTFSNPPLSGTLDLTGDGTASVSVTGLTSPYTFNAVVLPANGSAISLTASFSADVGCTFDNTSVVNAPFECSDDECADVIPPGSPVAAIAVGDVTFNITDPGANADPKTFNSIAIAGEPSPFTDLLVPDNISYSYNTPNASNQRIIEDGVNGATIADGTAIFDPALIAANTDRNLNHYYRTDGSIFATDFVNFEFNYDINSASNRYVIITERGGNNSMEVQAIDAFGNLIGTPRPINKVDGTDGPVTYIGTGVNNDNGQEVFATIYPLTAFVGPNVPINGVRLTQTGATGGDGGDGKVFIVYNPFFLTPPPTISLSSTFTQPVCPSNEGTITINATDNGGGTIEYSINGAAGPWQTSNVFNNVGPNNYNIAARYVSAPLCINTSPITYALLDGNCAADPCDATASGNADNDGDNVSDICDADDDNDGILDINELNCSPGFVDLSQTFTNVDTGTNGGTATVTLSNLYPFAGANVTTATFELQGSATWNDGVASQSTAGVTGDYINTQPNNTNFPNGDVGVYTYTFSEPVFNVNFKFGGLDNQDRVDFLALNGLQNVPVSVTGVDPTNEPLIVINGQSVISAEAGANAPSNAVAVEIEGPITTITITVGKENGNNGNVTMQFYELEYCTALDTDNDGVDDHLDLDADNDGIYDVDEAGNGALDNNNDGVIDTNDFGFNDGDSNGADDTAEGTVPTDTLNDGTFDFQNTDSDGDSCPDANEAYSNNNAAGSDGGQLGEPDPASVDLTNGLVTEPGVDYSVGTNTAVVNPADSSACDASDCFDVIPLGNPTAALSSSNVTLDITNPTVPNLPGILNSVTIAGEANPFTGILRPKAVNYQFGNPGATRQFIRDELVLQANITEGPEVFDPALIEANANTDLRHYLSLDNIIIPSDFVEFIYNTPIASAANRYIVVTERNGNNEVTIQALDNSLALTGNSVTVTAVDYFDTGAVTDFGQNVFIAIYPLTALVPSGTDVQGIRITQSGATGDGGDGKAFIIYDTAFLTPPPSIELTTSAEQPSCPSNLGSITIDATDNGGGAIEYSVNGAAGPWQTSNVFTGLSVGTYTPAARYQSTPSCVEVSLSDIELLPACCNIMDVTATNISACNDNGTDAIITDDTFTVDITVTFMASPGSGTLDLSGDIIDSVSAVGLTSPHTFTGITLPSNGDPLSVTVSFSAEAGCTPFMDESLFNAPFECSDEDCPDIIPTGNPTNVVVAADVTLNISSGSGPTDPAILNSVTIAGQPNPLTGIYTPNQADYQFGNPGVSNQFIRNQTVTEANITDGPAIFNPALIAANSENDLRHYLSLDNIILDTDFVDFDYNTPIASASNRYVVITERNGNNEVSVQALDNTLSPFGNTVVINDFDYFDTGVETDFSQNVYMAIYPLTALVPSGTDVQGIRITQSGASGGDGGDGKVFLLYDTAFLVPPPSIQITTSSIQPSCPSGLGSITIDATDNGGGIIEYSVNGASGPWQTSNVFNDLAPGTFTPATRYQGSPLCLEVSSTNIELTGVLCPSIETVKTVVITNDILPVGASLGDTMTYTITVANTGNVTLDGVGIADTFVDANGNPLVLSTGLTFVAADLGSSEGDLLVGETATYTATYVIGQDAVDAGGFSNSVFADGDSPADTNVDDTSDDDDDTDGNTEDDPTETTITEDPSIEAVKTVVITNDILPVGASLGDTMTYTITVANTGNVTLDGVGIADTFVDANGNPLVLSTGLTFVAADLGSSEGDLLVGETATYTATYVIGQDAVDAGGFSNSVFADGDSPADTNVDDTSDDDDDTDGNTEDDPTETTITEDPSIEAVKTVVITNDILPVGASLGDTMTYTITVANTGNVTLDGVGIADTFVDVNGNPLVLSTGPTFVAADLGSLEGDLLVGETATYTATYVIDQDAVDAGGFSNSVFADGDSPADTNVDDTSDDDDDTDGNTEDDPTETTITEDPSIEAVKTVVITNDILPVGASLGDTMTYTITVANTGNVTLDGVGIADTFVDANGNPLVLSTGPTFVAADLGSLEGDLLVGETATYTATYVIDQDAVDAGGFSNSVFADGDSPADTNVDDTSDDDDDTDGNTEDDPTETTITEDPSIEAVKTVVITNDILPVGASLGDTMTYTITVANTGNVTLDGVGIADTFVDANGNPLVLSTGLTFVAADLGSLEGDLLVGETATYTATYVIGQDAVDAGGFSNSVFADGDSPADTNVDDTSDDDDDTDGNTEDDPTETTITEDPSIEAVKTVVITNDILPVGASLGDTMTYTITVANTGNVTLDGVGIADTFVDANGNPLVLSTGPTFVAADLGSLEGDLLVGETATYTATYVIDQDAVDAGGFSNSVFADGDSPADTNVDDTSDDDDDTDGNTEDDPTETTITEDPSIEAVKTVVITNDILPVGASLGDTMTYTITVANTGNVTLDGVGIADTFVDVNGNPLVLSTGPTFVAADLGSLEGDLLVGETATYTATYVIGQDAVDAGGFSNSVFADGDSPADTNVDDTSDDDDDTDGNTEDDPTETTITEDPSIEAVKTVVITNDILPVGASLGDTMTYTITVANTGNVTLDGVGIADTFVDANGNPLVLSTGPTFVAADLGSLEGDLLVGETATYTATYVIDQDAVDAGGFSNSVFADGDSPADTNVDDTSDDDDDTDGNTEDDPTETTITEDPSIEAVKTVVITNDILPVGASLGDTMTYTITVANTGNVTLDGVGIADTFVDANGNPLVLSTGLTFVAADLGSLEGDLLVGETATYTATYVIDQDAVDAGGFSNSVFADGDSPADTNVDDTSDDDDDTDGNTEDDPTETTITEDPSIEAVKTVVITNDILPVGASLGDTMTYTITVANTGNVTLDGVGIADTFVDANGNPLVLSTGLTFVAADLGSLEGDLLVGETATYTATYVIDQDAVDAGGFSNSVFADGDSPADTNVDDTSDDDDDTDGNTEDDPTETIIVPDPSISLVKTTLPLEDTNGDGIAGSIDDIISYVFVVENTGNVTLSNIEVQDALPGLILVGGPILELIPGQVDSTTFTATYQITQDDLDVGFVINSATVSSEAPGGDLDDDSDDVTDTSDDPNDDNNDDDNGDGEPDDPTVTPVNSIFDLEVDKVVSELQPAVGAQVTFTIEAANIGNVTATDIIISEEIPSGYVFVSAITTAGTYSEFDGEWTIAQLNPDQVEILEITVEVLGFGDYLNTAFVSSAVGGVDIDPNNDEDTAAVDPICLTIYNEFSPDGNGVNDTFVIDCLERFPNNKLEIYNRWGNLVYSKRGYLNDWNGTSNGRAVINQSDNLPVGTYYYVLDLGDGSEPRVDWLYINRNN